MINSLKVWALQKVQRKNTKGQALGGGVMAGAVALVGGLLVLTIFSSISGEVLGDIAAGQTASSTERMITDNGSQGILNFANYFDTTGTVMGAVLILTVLIGGLAAIGFVRS